VVKRATKLAWEALSKPLAAMSHGPGWHELSPFVTRFWVRAGNVHISANTPEYTEIEVLRFRPPGIDRWRLLYQASGPLLQVLDRALQTLPFVYFCFTTFAFLPVKLIGECPA
jgi:hypothetical protein